MLRVALDALESASNDLESIIGTVSLLSVSVGGKTATQQEITGCIQLILQAAIGCKERLDEAAERENKPEAVA